MQNDKKDLASSWRLPRVQPRGLLATGRLFEFRPVARSQQPAAKKGFTLIELLLYVGLASILLFVFSMFLAMLLQARIKNQAIAEVDQQGLLVMRMITQAVRNADAIVIPAQGASAASLRLQTVIASTNPTIFDVNASSSIRITEGTATSMPLTNARVTASGLTFQNLSRPGTPGIVRIQFTLTHINPSNKNEYRVQKIFTTSASLR